MVTPQLKAAANAWKKPAIVHPAGVDLKQIKDAILEIGPGRGDFLFHLAEKNPSSTVIGIEIKKKRFDKLIKRIQRLKLSNIILICCDARDAMPNFFKDGQISQIHILFPDPWPKRRHTHNRLFTQDFLRECARILKENGVLYFTTDHEEYAKNVALEVHNMSLPGLPAHRSLGEVGTGQSRTKMDPRIKSEDDRKDQHVDDNMPETFETFFAKKWKEMGRKFYHQRYVKNPTP